MIEVFALNHCAAHIQEWLPLPLLPWIRRLPTYDTTVARVTWSEKAWRYTGLQGMTVSTMLFWIQWLKQPSQPSLNYLRILWQHGCHLAEFTTFLYRVQWKPREAFVNKQFIIPIRFTRELMVTAVYLQTRLFSKQLLAHKGRFASKEDLHHRLAPGWQTLRYLRKEP